MSDSSTTSKKGHGGSRKQDILMVPADAITGRYHDDFIFIDPYKLSNLRNLYAKFYLETHAPTVAEFADIWKNLDHETAEVRFVCGSVPKFADFAM